MKDTVNAYSQIPPIPGFQQIFDSQYYYHPPGSWYLVMTDIVDSTPAIREGRYKEVNTAGSLAAMAISNLTNNMDFPFLFGGDGMTYLIPEAWLQGVKEVLIDTRDLVKKSFNLELRLGYIRIDRLKELGGTIQVARLPLSEAYSQAIISGDGIDLAEQLIKEDREDNPYRIGLDEPLPGEADFSGFTCRWQDIPSNKGETLSLIIKGRGETSAQRGVVLQEVLKKIEEVFGEEEEYHPLSRDNQRMGFLQGKREALVFAGGKKNLRYRIHLLIIWIEMVLTRLLEIFHIPFKRGKKNISRVRQDNIVNSDFRKFDGTLKMVISCTRNQRISFERYLSKARKKGLLFYGLHKTNRALITCLIQFNSGQEVHFIDGADGGYALAAKALKEQISQE